MVHKNERAHYTRQKRRRRIDGETTRCSALQATGRSRTLVRLATTEHGRRRGRRRRSPRNHRRRTTRLFHGRSRVAHTVRRRSAVGRGVGETPAASRPAIVVSFFLTTTYVMLLYRLCGSTAVKLDGPFYIIYACRYPNACACGSRVCYNNIITLYYIM